MLKYDQWDSGRKTLILSTHLPEILAPAGGLEQLAAAVKSGADAVYFGAAGFNARRNAENFTDADFLSAVSYCRVRGVKVYITLNTVLRDAELGDFARTLALAAKSGADAVIVQDLAAAAMVKTYYPSLRLHASTQMAVHNLSGVRELEDYGFSRVVLARELSLKEIETVCAAAKAEIEVFVHGAHCMSFSGLCYTSCAFGGRSANRGLCAQPCRLNFANDKREYALSLKDMSLVEHLDRLKDAGVCSFKIEGRMKRPEYVAAAVTACREKLAGRAPDTDTLRSVFSRGGFTDGYLTGRVNGRMFGHRTKEDVTAAAGVLKSLQRLYDKEAPRVAIGMALSVLPGRNAELRLTDGEREVLALGPEPEAARNMPLTAEKAAASLTKLGDTPFFCPSPACEIVPGLMLPASALNAMRREAVEQLAALRGAPAPVPDRTADILRSLETGDGGVSHAQSEAGLPALRLRFQSASQLFTLPECGRYILPLYSLLKAPELLGQGELAAEVPVLTFPGDEAKTLEALISLKQKGLRYAVAENIGAIRLIREAGLIPTGGAHLNITNRLALSQYEALGCRDNTLSFELSFGDMAALKSAGKTGFLAYGHMPLMRFRACPARSDAGCGDCKGAAAVTDRKKETFRILCSGRRFSTMFNPVPTYTVGLREPDCAFRTLYFTYETREECIAVARAYLAGRKLQTPVTAGMYNKKLM